MVEQYRKPLERSLLEIPAGKLEVGEEPKLTAERELEEETGYRAGNIEHLISFYTSPGFANELLHLYIATNLEKVENPLAGDEDEFLEHHELALDVTLKAVVTKVIYEANNVYDVKDLHIKLTMTSK